MGVYLLALLFNFIIQSAEKDILKWEIIDPEKDIASWPLGKHHLSSDNNLTVAAYATENNRGYLAEVGKKLTRFCIKDPLQFSASELHQADNRITIISSACFLIAFYGGGIKVNTVSYHDKEPSIKVVQTINMPEDRNDASYLKLNKNTLELTGACWQFIRVWEKIKGKNEWKLKTEIIDKDQFEEPEIITAENINQAKLKAKGPSIYSIIWVDDSTVKTEGFEGKDTRYWDLKTGEQKEAPAQIEEISLTSAGSRLLLALTEE